MKLELGKTYLTEKGIEVKITGEIKTLQYDGLGDYTYYYSDHFGNTYFAGGAVFTDTGNASLLVKEKFTPYDLWFIRNKDNPSLVEHAIYNTLNEAQNDLRGYSKIYEIVRVRTQEFDRE